jgi:hypothetical protein
VIGSLGFEAKEVTTTSKMSRVINFLRFNFIACKDIAHRWISFHIFANDDRDIHLVFKA